MKHAFLILIIITCTPHPSETAFAQATTLALPTRANTSSFTITDDTSNVLMKLFGDGGFYVLGNVTLGSIPATGSGARMLWYPFKRAFRAGFVSSTQWDDANIGQYSMATGNQTTASGLASTAMGTSSLASGIASTSFGAGSTAGGDYSHAAGRFSIASGFSAVALGESDTASGTNAIAMGFGSLASGYSSVAVGGESKAVADYAFAVGWNAISSGLGSRAMGFSAIASQTNATAIGAQTTASGYAATAIGRVATASGDASMAMGSYVSTNDKGGAFILGDESTTDIAYSSALNELTTRFAGGYRLFSNSGMSVGVSLAASGNSWATISDSAKKTSFLDSDGEMFLCSLSKLKLGSWSYKTQDEGSFRHYGPMAQEIFNYFGRDAYGTIGNDTTLATADMDGIIMICLQALEKRTAQLTLAQEKVTMLEDELKRQKSSNDKSTEQFEGRIVRLERLAMSSGVKGATNNVAAIQTKEERP